MIAPRETSVADEARQKRAEAAHLTMRRPGLTRWQSLGSVRPNPINGALNVRGNPCRARRRLSGTARLGPQDLRPIPRHLLERPGGQGSLPDGIRRRIDPG